MKPDKAKELIKETFEQSFDKDRFVWFVKNLFPDKIEFRNKVYTGNYIKEAYRAYIRKYEQVGKFEDEEGSTIDLLAVELLRGQSVERARTSQRNFIAQYLKNKNHREGALVAFYSEGSDDWRFSLIKMEYSLEKKKDELTPAKRFSFLVGKDEKSHTAQNQLTGLLTMQTVPTLPEIEAAFNIETVTKEFFEKYKQLFLDLNDHVEKEIKKSKPLREELESRNIDAPAFTKKLLGQIVFLYFLQKKGWLGVPKEGKMSEGNKKYLRTLLIEAISKDKYFFSDYLVFLFYEALATEHNEEGVEYYYKKLKCRIPFLNGGLFEADYNWEKITVDIPNKLFTNRNKTKEGDEGDGILDVFDRYNFTVKEDEPLDKEVAVDPEMLGKVFENLLEVKDRKSKGAFYTPREIVHYMCQESLIAYLDTAINGEATSFQKLGTEQTDMFGNKARKGQLALEVEHGNGNIKVSRETIETLIRDSNQLKEYVTQAVANEKKIEAGEIKSSVYKLTEHFNEIKKHAAELDGALHNIRICDPAIGSGAFPVGMMNEIVKAREILTVYFKDAEQNERTAYELKRHAIQECIYGVDIDHSAIDIAKLRLWLSLVVDENDLSRVKPLPNLDYKIVWGNSLIGMPENSMRNAKIEDEIRELEDQLFDEREKDKKDKIRSKIENKIRMLLDSAEQFSGYKIDFDFKIFFSKVFNIKQNRKEGFDIVIGNPPYVKARDNNDKIIRKQIEKNFKTTYKMWDLFVPFVEQGLNIICGSGNMTMIIPDTIGRADYTRKLVDLIEKNHTLYRIDFFPDSKIFENAAVKNKIIFVFKNKSSIKTVRTIRSKHFNDFKELSDVVGINKYHYETAQFELDKTNTINLSNICFVSYGLRLNSDKADKNKFQKKDLLSKTKSKINYKLYTEGKFLSKYLIEKELYLEWGTDRCPGKLVRPTFPELYEPQKLLLSRQKRIAAISNEELVCDNTIIVCILAKDLKDVNNSNIRKYYSNIGKERKQIEKESNNFNLKYILSLINSSLIQYFIKHHSKGNIDFYPDDWKNIPIKKVSEQKQTSFITLVDKILEMKKQDPQANTTSREKQLDIMVYHLYNLTYEEAKIIDAGLSEEDFHRYKL